jgi:Ca2+-binding EF-hand superfamily protein
VLDQIE